MPCGRKQAASGPLEGLGRWVGRQRPPRRIDSKGVPGLWRILQRRGADSSVGATPRMLHPCGHVAGEGVTRTRGSRKNRATYAEFRLYSIVGRKSVESPDATNKAHWESFLLGEC